MLTLPRYAQTATIDVDGAARLELEVDAPAGTASPLRLPLMSAALEETIALSGDTAHAVATDTRFASVTIDDSEPPAAETSTAPPFAVVFRFKERRLSPTVPALLAALALVYPVRFRDLTRTGAAP